MNIMLPKMIFYENKEDVFIMFTLYSLPGGYIRFPGCSDGCVIGLGFHTNARCRLKQTHREGQV